MKTILYLAPYRNYAFRSICNNHIQSLMNETDLYIRPLYSSNMICDINTDILKIENKQLLKEYDVVLQHGPVGYCFPMEKIAAKNFYIPIIDYNDSYIDRHNLSGFTKVLVDSKSDEMFLSKYINQKQIKLFNYDLIKDTNPRNDILDVPYINNKYKLHCIINEYNIKYFYSILLACFSNMFVNDSVCLIVSVDCQEIEQKVKNELMKLIQITKFKRLKHLIHIYRIVSDHSLASICLGTDCLIDIKTHTNSNFHYCLSQLNNKSYITQNCQTITQTSVLDYNSEPAQLSIDELALKIKNIIGAKSINKENNIPLLKNII